MYTCTPLRGYNLLARHAGNPRNRGQMSVKAYISCMKAEVLCHLQKATLTDYIHTEVYRVHQTAAGSPGPDHRDHATAANTKDGFHSSHYFGFFHAFSWSSEQFPVAVHSPTKSWCPLNPPLTLRFRVHVYSSWMSQARMGSGTAQERQKKPTGKRLSRVRPGLEQKT